MAESTIDVFYDMDIAQICEHFQKSRNTVDKAVAKLVKDYPDKEYKYKNPNTRRITIKAEGVEKLAAYFRKEKKEVSFVETQLRMENDKLKALLEEKEKSIRRMDSLYTQKLQLELEKFHQTFLLENKDKEHKIEVLESENETLKSDLEKAKEVQEKLEEYKKKEEEYNSKSLFYRMMHKFSL